MSTGTRVERMQEVLRTIQKTTVDIVGSAILTSDGFVVASKLPPEVDEEMVTGMASTLLGVGEQIAREMMGSELEQVYVKAKTGYVIVNSVTADEVLIIVTTKDVKLGLVFNEVRKRVAELAKLL